jgi:hypothetical protein
MEEGEKLQDELGRQKCLQIIVNSWDGGEDPTMMRGDVKLLGKVGNCKRQSWTAIT